MVHITAQWEFNSDEGGSQPGSSSSLVIQIFTFTSNNPVWLLTKWYLFHSCTETARNSPKTTWIFSMFPCGRAIRGITSVTLYVSHLLPCDPLARHIRRFDSELDTRDQSSTIMMLLPRVTSPLVREGGKDMRQALQSIYLFH